MNRKRKSYDRYTVGTRIQNRRISLGLSQEELAERIDRATKYCSDIERGVCGMSVETMLSFSEELKMSLDYMMYGMGEIVKKTVTETAAATETAVPNETAMPKETPSGTKLERTELQQLIEQCTDRQYSYAVQMLKLLLKSPNPDENTTE